MKSIEDIRKTLIPLIGRRANIVHNGAVNGDLLIKDVGEVYLFGSRSYSPDPEIPLESIQSVSWDDVAHRRIEFEKTV